MALFHWEQEPYKGAVVLVHGTGEHHGRYQHVIQRLIEAGYQVWSADLPGWGRAPGIKGHINRFTEYLDTVHEWVRTARQQVPARLPLYLLGHSLGGLIVTRYVEVYGADKLDGLVLSSPCLALRLEVPRWKLGVADMLDHVWPTLRFGNGITPDMVSRDQVVQVSYQMDPLNFPKASVRWFTELQKAMEASWRELEKVVLPCLILQAGADRLIDAERVADFARRIPAPKKAYTEYQGLYHEILNEPEREVVLRDLIRWLDEQTEQKE